MQLLKKYKRKKKETVKHLNFFRTFEISTVRRIENFILRSSKHTSNFTMKLRHTLPLADHNTSIMIQAQCSTNLFNFCFSLIMYFKELLTLYPFIMFINCMSDKVH